MKWYDNTKYFYNVTSCYTTNAIAQHCSVYTQCLAISLAIHCDLQKVVMRDYLSTEI
jgi:hypothetical protein